MTAIIQVLIDELKTIQKYTELLTETNCPTCFNTIKEIIDDEWVHVGNALQIIEHDPHVSELIIQGKNEVVANAVTTNTMLSPDYHP